MVLSDASHAMALQLDPLGPLPKNVAVPSGIVLNGLKSSDQRTVWPVLFVPQARRSALSGRYTRASQPEVGEEEEVGLVKTVGIVLTSVALKLPSPFNGWAGSNGLRKKRLMLLPDPQLPPPAGTVPTALVTSRTEMFRKPTFPPDMMARALPGSR